MIKYKLSHNYDNGNIKVSIEDNVPTLCFNTFNFANKDNKMEVKRINFNESQINKILIDTKNNASNDSLIEILKGTKSYAKKELENKFRTLYESPIDDSAEYPDYE